LTTVVSSFITITCDGTCGKSVTFAQNEPAQQEAVKDNPWLGTIRFVNMPDNRKFGYCSDECELAGITAGSHNPVQPKPQIVTGTDASVALAARAAEQARLAQEALRKGTGVHVHEA
jgi:hypothetical protein